MLAAHHRRTKPIMDSLNRKLVSRLPSRCYNRLITREGYSGIDRRIVWTRELTLHVDRKSGSAFVDEAFLPPISPQQREGELLGLNLSELLARSLRVSQTNEPPRVVTFRPESVESQQNFFSVDALELVGRKPLGTPKSLPPPSRPSADDEFRIFPPPTERVKDKYYFLEEQSKKRTEVLKRSERQLADQQVQNLKVRERRKLDSKYFRHYHSR